MGYQVVSISGGEPFLYRRLADLLRHARALGMQTTVITNGYFSTRVTRSRCAAASTCLQSASTARLRSTTADESRVVRVR
jgi:organic radical activating enzyme